MNRFLLHLDNFDDLFISADLRGDEVDFIQKIERVLHKRHPAVSPGSRIVRVIKVG